MEKQKDKKKKKQKEEDKNKSLLPESTFDNNGNKVFILTESLNNGK
jgi:hypothetical protein